MIAACEPFQIAIPTITDTQFLRADGTVNLNGDMLIEGGTKIYFDNTNNYIGALSSTQLRLNAAQEMFLSISGSVEALLTANVFTFNSGVSSVGLDWATDSELDILVGGTAQVTFTDGTFEPERTNYTDLGTSSLQFKRAFFSGAVLASTYESDVATGTAPFTVASTTEVANLRCSNAANADDSDKVDGLHVATSGGAIGALDAANTWSANQLFSGATELRLRSSATRIYSSFTGFMTCDASLIFDLQIAGTSKLALSATVGSFSVKCTATQFESSIADGTVPLIVASATRVANLNVTDSDQVDGLHAADLNPATTKGDLILQDASATVRLPVGANGDFLQAQSGESSGVKWSPAAGGGDVTAGAVMADNSIVRGDGGSKGVQDSGILIDDSDNMTGVTTLAVDVATGTAPLTIASTTVVANLNVDQVGGKEAAELNPLTTKGDVSGYSTETARIPVGSNDQVLTADSAQALGVKWATPSGGSGASLTVSTTTVFSGTSPTSMTNLDLSGTVGVNVALVALSFKSAADMNALAVRTDGDANEYYAQNADANAYGVQLGHADDAADLVLIVATNSSGVIEWRTEVALTCTVDILWYIK